MQELTKRQQTNRENNKREIKANKQMKNIKKTKCTNTKTDRERERPVMLEFVSDCHVCTVWKTNELQIFEVFSEMKFVENYRLKYSLKVNLEPLIALQDTFSSIKKNKDNTLT